MNEWLDGRRLVRWLRQEGIYPDKNLPRSQARRIHEWQQGQNASVYTVDKLLTATDHHLSELPDELYVKPPNFNPNPVPPKGSPITPYVRRAIWRAGQRGIPTKAIAKTYGISLESARRYKREKPT